MYQAPGARTAIVALPAEVDVSNADEVYDLLDAAAGPGTRVVIADCGDTTFCDVAGVRRLVAIRTRAAARGVQVRLAIPPGGALRRMIELMGADSLLPVYSSVGQASMMLVVPAQDPLSGQLSGQPEGAP